MSERPPEPDLSEEELSLLDQCWDDLEQWVRVNTDDQ